MRGLPKGDWGWTDDLAIGIAANVGKSRVQKLRQDRCQLPEDGPARAVERGFGQSSLRAEIPNAGDEPSRLRECADIVEVNL